MADLTYRAVDIRRATKAIFFDVVRGFDERPEVRGGDLVIPSRPGLDRRNRVEDRLAVELAGWVWGQGSTVELRRADYLARIDELRAILDATLDPGALVATGPYLGLATGQTATIQVAFLNIVPGELKGGFFRRMSVELECIANPPAWVRAGP